MRALSHLVTALACITLLAACSELMGGNANDPKHPRRNSSARAQPAINPAIASPASHKTCTETFKLEVNTPRYDKCIASLSELEAKP